MKSTTISEIAKSLGLSVATVSRALSDYPFVKDETRNLVRAKAEELNYLPNTLAKSLKNSRSNVIGVIVPGISYEFFAKAISGIEKVAYNSGYTILVTQSNESFEREKINTETLIQQRVAGIIASVSQETRNGDHFQMATERGIPVVFFDRTCESIYASKVIIDDRKSAFTAVDYLIKKGHKRIAHFAGPEDLDIVRNRVDGYTDALKRAEIPVDSRLICYGGLHESDGYNAMDSLLKDNIKPDAIFAVDDAVAIGAFQRIKEAGLKIPSDIAIIGFSDDRTTALVDPPITTVRQPSFEMGCQSAEILMELINSKNKSMESRIIVLNTELVIRESA